MIPKIIHYCWFGGGEYTDKVKMCIASWRKILPEYEIRLWNEDNVDLNESPYIKDAYTAGKYAFVSDYVRMKVLEEYGGIYLDVDMEVKQPLDKFLKYRCCLGTDDSGDVETMIMAEPHHPLLQNLKQEYQNLPFLLPDGTMNLEVVNMIMNKFMYPLGFKRINERQSLKEGIEVYPDEYFQGVSLVTGKPHFTENTYIVHWHTLLWVSWKTRVIRFLRMYILVPILGRKLYTKITNFLKR